MLGYATTLRGRERAAIHKSVFGAELSAAMTTKETKNQNQKKQGQNSSADRTRVHTGPSRGIL